ncbi:MAG: AAA family ATPase, partial [Elusimicrobiales bacterium]|nr:AAA family ATPase [Elusimicrobiales bacterium]
NQGAAALKAGVPIGLELLAREHKLDERAKIVICYLLYRELERAGRCLASPLHFLCALYGLEKLELAHYFIAEQGIFESGVFDGERGYRENALRMEFRLLQPHMTLVLTGKAEKKKAAKRAAAHLPGAIYKRLDKVVISQDEAKRKLASIAYQHQLRPKNKPRKGVTPRLNTLLIGPTGCGKTHVVRTLAEALRVPVVFCDATQYTETGYVGSCVEEMLYQLYVKAGKDVDNMRRGIIFIDEFDKLAGREVGGQHNSPRDVSGLSVQQELLKMLEGDEVRYERRSGFGSETLKFPVRNILFILAGAFVGLDKLVTERLRRKGRIGFSGDGSDRAPAAGRTLSKVCIEDMVEYGMMPELMGRIPNMVALEPLETGHLAEILRNEETSLLTHYREFFRARGVDIEVPEAFILDVAERARARGLGARGLNAFLEACFSELIFEHGRTAEAGAAAAGGAAEGTGAVGAVDGAPLKVNIADFFGPDKIDRLLG